MINLIRADLFKLWRGKAVKISFLLICVSATAFTIISRLMAQGKFDTTLSNQVAGLSDIVMLSIICPFLAGAFICGDFENKTVHDAISFGSGRGKLIVSKAIVYFLVSGLMMLPYAVATLIGYGTGKEFKAFTASTYLDILARESKDMTGSMIMKIVAVILCVMIVYIAKLSICVLVAFILQRSALVVCIGFAALLLSDLLIVVGEKIKPLGDLLSFTPLAMGYRVISMDVGAGVLVKSVIVSVIYIVIMLAITIRIFKRKEIK
jgi:ABC-2 type transport system permease protein